MVAPIHEQGHAGDSAERREIDRWLSLPAEEALKLQRPLPDDALKIVAITEKERNSAAVSLEKGGGQQQVPLV